MESGRPERREARCHDILRAIDECRTQPLGDSRFNRENRRRPDRANKFNDSGGAKASPLNPPLPPPLPARPRYFTPSWHAKA